MTARVESKCASYQTENADEWLQRCRRQLLRSSAPIDPTSAAWAFVQWKEDGSVCGTGISFLDLVLKKNHRQNNKLPIIDIQGERQSGKTWTLLSLAARFVVATRPSAFDATSSSTPKNIISLPQVIIFDSNQDITASKLVYTVRATLLKQYGGIELNNHQYMADMESCLTRIHIAVARDTWEWVPILETLRYKLMSMGEYPTLLLWDGFLGTAPSDTIARMEAMRQLTRLLQDCCIMLVTTTSSKYRRYDWDKIVTHRIRLERVKSDTQKGTEFVAVVNEDRVPFSLSLSGVLS